MVNVKNKIIQPERSVEISVKGFIRDDLLIGQIKEENYSLSKDGTEKGNHGDFIEYYY